MLENTPLKFLTTAQVTDTRITIAVEPNDSAADALDLPERCRILKLANSITYDRLARVMCT